MEDGGVSAPGGEKKWSVWDWSEEVASLEKCISNRSCHRDH